MIPDVDVAEVGRGLYWAAVTVPPAFFPAAAGGTLDLSVHFDQNGATASALEPGALRANNATPPLLAMLVLDRSGSMADYGEGKLEGLRVAAQLAVDGMLDVDELGIVTFSDDAQTALPLLPLGVGHRGAATGAIRAITAYGRTSIGDGLFEAQAALAARQNVTDPADPRRHMMLLMSDGLNNRDFPPDDYYLSETANPVSDGDNEPYPPPSTGAYFLNYQSRVNNTLTIPQVHAIALGQDADLVHLHNIATRTGGVFSYAANHLAVEAVDVALELSDVFRIGLDDATGLQRVAAVRVPSTAATELPVLAVEPFAAELVVSVAAPVERSGADALLLVAPSGAASAPVASTPVTAVFRVASPEAGEWSFASAAPASATGTPAVFVEHAVRSGLVLFASADAVDAASPTSDPADNGRIVGSWVTIRAVLAEKATIPGAAVTAEVTPPGSLPIQLELRDDGRGYDGASDDGIYAATLRSTGAAGVYRVRVIATGTAPTTDAAFRREAHFAFELHPGPDADSDGLPDEWELRHGTDPAVPDAGADPDGDGLTNLEELQSGTEPWQSDSDFGGESDLSELTRGSDPFRPEDDEFPRFTPTLCPGNGKVTVVPNLPFPAELVNFELQEVAPSGDRSPVTRVVVDIIGTDPGVEIRDPNQPPTPVELVAQNGEELCIEMRLRGFAFGVDSGFSPTSCVTPSEDPYPPEVRVSLGDLASGVSRTRDVSVRIDALDDLLALEEACSPRDPEAVTTGVTDVRVSTRADFAGAGWEPFTPARSVWLPDQPRSAIWVQVRDGAGNVSRPVYAIVELVAKTPLDDAIRHDERALDLLGAGSFAAAVNEIAAGMPSFLRTLQTVRRRAVPALRADPVDAALYAELQAAHTWKQATLSAGGPRRLADASAALRAALVHERNAAQLAADTGREL